jgi:lysine-N-methylase
MKKNADNGYSLHQFAFVREFSCLGDKCEDTCCKGWGMQVDPPHKKLYEKEAPELLAALDSGESDIIMKRDPKTGYCVKFSNGLCGIHQEYGEKFLGDACYFYPRATRGLGDYHALMTATLSCPEITRLVLYGNDPFALVETVVERVPDSIADYMFEALSPEAARSLILMFINAAGDESVTPEHSMLRLVSVAKSMEFMDAAQWMEAVPFYLRTADARLLAGAPQQADPYKLLHALCALIGAARIIGRPRLQETVDAMLAALDASMDWSSLQIQSNRTELTAYEALKKRWEQKAASALAPVLRRYIQGQLALAMFPFSGFGDTLSDRMNIIAIRFATIRLALMAHMNEDGTPPDEATTTRVIQSICRFIDHLESPVLSLSIYNEAGWLKESRMRGLLEG